MANIKVLVADASHEKYVDTILDTIRTAAKKRGTGIAERTHEYVATKMKEGKAILLQSVSRTIRSLWLVSVGLMQRYSLLQVEML